MKIMDFDPPITSNGGAGCVAGLGASMCTGSCSGGGGAGRFVADVRHQTKLAASTIDPITAPMRNARFPLPMRMFYPTARRA